jgi:hypothetical protein
LNGNLAAMGQIDHVGFSGIGEALTAVVDELIVGICLPPFKAARRLTSLEAVSWVAAMLAPETVLPEHQQFGHPARR